jgi:hypothetical protein
VIEGQETLDKDRMLTQAMSDAARSASKLMNSYTLPKAIILQCKGQNVVLSRGERDGMVVGQKMMIRRGQKVIGEVRIFKVSGDRAWAKILPGTDPINRGDEAKAIFMLT